MKWAVILDADETILDNSQFELELARNPLPRNQIGAAFDAWCKREQSLALPGAKDFLQAIHRMGGHIAVVTNRSEGVCENTRRNLRNEGLTFDEVECRRTESEDKNPRFAEVEERWRVVMWFGDKIEDFPGMTQIDMRDANDSAFADFGKKYFIFPNPMYGSWTKNDIEKVTISAEVEPSR